MNINNDCRDLKGSRADLMKWEGGRISGQDDLRDLFYC